MNSVSIFISFIIFLLNIIIITSFRPATKLVTGTRGKIISNPDNLIRRLKTFALQYKTFDEFLDSMVLLLLLLLVLLLLLLLLILLLLLLSLLLLLLLLLSLLLLLLLL